MKARISVVMRGACFFIALATGMNGANASGIPVVDVAGLAQAVAQYTTMVEELATLKQQYDTAVEQLSSLKEQAETMKSMYDSLSGVSGHANMLNGAVSQLHSFLPAELQDISGLMTGQVAALAASLRSANEEFTGDVVFPGQGLLRKKAQYDKAGDYVFGYAAQAKAAFDGFAARRATLESLSTAATTATTPKATLDLIAKTSAENALLLNDIALMLALDLKARMDGEALKRNAEALQAAPGATSSSIQIN